MDMKLDIVKWLRAAAIGSLTDDVAKRRLTEAAAEIEDLRAAYVAECNRTAQLVADLSRAVDGEPC